MYRPPNAASAVLFEWVPYGPVWLGLQPDKARKLTKIRYAVFLRKNDQPEVVS
jgi:hypothetical protein